MTECTSSNLDDVERNNICENVVGENLCWWFQYNPFVPRYYQIPT